MGPGSCPEKAYRAAAAAAMQQMMERWEATYEHFSKEDPKQCHYLSMEYLLGRGLRNAVGCLGMEGEFGEALKKMGWKLEELATEESDPGLGNGGLGRLAACYLDSMATLDLPGWGYAVRYKFGLFRQVLDAEGRQHERAEPWLEHGNPWEVKRANIRFPIRFGGSVKEGKWVPAQTVMAVAYDMPIPGYKTKNVITLRAWDAEPITADFDMFKFNECEHDAALADFKLAQTLTAVLYPGDIPREGKALRLRQQYMLSSASAQDIVARFEQRAARAGKPPNWDDLSNKVAIQMNDTHPTLAAPELQRILVDEKGLPWDQAFGIMSKCVAYTNHTLLPEALEQWPLDLMEELLPRHVEIIQRIDREFIVKVKAKYSSMPKQELYATLSHMTAMGNFYDEGAPAEPFSAQRAAEKPVVRMANLCIICGFAINGVAQMHSDLCKEMVFTDFAKLWPEKFHNKTNGVTPRRWLAFANPELGAVVTKWLGSDAWIKEAAKLTGLKDKASDPKLQEEWTAVKTARKRELLELLWTSLGDGVKGPAMGDASEWLFDIQIKRMHEYKRQLLNLFGCVHRYNKLKAMSPGDRAKQVRRVTIIGGKAFYSYWAAKECVALCNAIGRVVNNDPEVNGVMRVYFMPNYNVSAAEKLIPAAELSEHISTAGLEASGTSNMKFQMNGCLLIGTLDGANVEIRECVGEENFFLFGTTADKVPGLRAERAAGKFTPSPRFLEIKELFKKGPFGDWSALMSSLEGDSGFGRGDHFLLGYDFPGYIEAQERVEKMYQDKAAWARGSIMSTATSGQFSSDRSIKEYAEDTWKVKPCPVP
uniref:Alpha-1,4 glucan phosphorylase n=1 Tax=Alexandrium catenella TaxID=2925 RepID=A0A7S1RN05_ALECA